MCNKVCHAAREHALTMNCSLIFKPKHRKLISLHDNGEDEKHAHGFADFWLLGTYFDLKHA
jgi:hypothetical protein